MDQINRYQGKLSGPLLDRIDLHVELSAQSIIIPEKKLVMESSDIIRQRVIQAYELQLVRNKCVNARLSTQQIEPICTLTTSAKNLLGSALEKSLLSVPRGILSSIIKSGTYDC